MARGEWAQRPDGYLEPLNEPVCILATGQTVIAALQRLGQLFAICKLRIRDEENE